MEDYIYIWRNCVQFSHSLESKYDERSECKYKASRVHQLHPSASDGATSTSPFELYQQPLKRMKWGHQREHFILLYSAKSHIQQSILHIIVNSFNWKGRKRTNTLVQENWWSEHDGSQIDLTILKIHNPNWLIHGRTASLIKRNRWIKGEIWRSS